MKSGTADEDVVDRRRPNGTPDELIFDRCIDVVAAADLDAVDIDGDPRPDASGRVDVGDDELRKERAADDGTPSAAWSETDVGWMPRSFSARGARGTEPRLNPVAVHPRTASSMHPTTATALTLFVVVAASIATACSDGSATPATDATDATGTGGAGAGSAPSSGTSDRVDSGVPGDADEPDGGVGPRDGGTAVDDDAVDDAGVDDAFVEPPLPPPLSFFFAQQQAALAGRRQACGLAAPAPLPTDLVEHLTTRQEYEAHRGCAATLATSSCSAAVVQTGALREVPLCLSAEPDVYDAAAPALPCPFAVDDFTYDAHRERFSLHNAYWLLWMATTTNLADPQLIRAAFADRGLDTVRVLQQERLTVAVVERETDVAFVFKGSTETSDYLSNASYVMKSADETGLPGRVHSGFYATLASGFAALEAELRGAHDRGKTIVLAGHSLGGACAQMAALKADGLGIEVAQLYSFSSPRPGDAVFAAALEALLGERLHRINNGLDITPHVPPAEAAEDTARAAIIEVLGNARDPGFVLGSLDVTLQAGLLLANYTHAGGSYVFDPTGYLQARDPGRGDDEQAYWQQLPDVVGEDDLVDVAVGFGQLPAWHDDDTHLCYQARVIEQLLYPRD